MLKLYDLIALLLIAIPLEILMLLLIKIYKYYKKSSGKGRKVGGEVLKDIGIALLVGGALKWNVNELIYSVVLIISLMFIILGAIMKYDEK